MDKFSKNLWNNIHFNLICILFQYHNGDHFYKNTHVKLNCKRHLFPFWIRTQMDSNRVWVILLFNLTWNDEPLFSSSLHCWDVSDTLDSGFLIETVTSVSFVMFLVPGLVFSLPMFSLVSLALASASSTSSVFLSPAALHHQSPPQY